MIVIEAIDNSIEKSIFMAGGITGCPDWQQEMLNFFKDQDVFFYNPRRKEFPIGDSNASLEQIKWEFRHLQIADAILFWFCAETLNPIVLFEYGKWLVSDKKIFVGCHPNYARINDIKIQTSLVRQDQVIHTDLESLSKEIISWIDEKPFFVRDT